MSRSIATTSKNANASVTTSDFIPAAERLVCEIRATSVAAAFCVDASSRKAGADIAGLYLSDTALRAPLDRLTVTGLPGFLWLNDKFCGLHLLGLSHFRRCFSPPDA